MPVEMLLALVLVLPIILMFAVFIWYLNIGGIYTAVKEKRQKRQAAADSKKLETSRL
jgi:hypothetical protein